ncbi:MAG TPA: hypothetical protein VEW69_04900 [Alphaproteobacteria bacterium]|nr:hypothetical protein [Alphaproteobacteria bacterium]
MSTSILTSVASQPVPSGRTHRRMVTLGAIVAILGTAAILVYGTGYYLSSPMDRPYHPRHAMLRPSGPVGLGLGVFGFFLFVLIFLYPLRKRWLWLSKIGNSRHWFDWHILMGLTAPVIIAFHASFKFRGIAGMAYWIMFSVAASGIVGRYIFAQIPRSRNSAELSLQESKHLQETLTAELGAQKVLRPADLVQLFRLPSEGYVASKSGLRALFTLFWIDMQRPFRVARLRRSVLGPLDKLLTLGGLFASRNRKLERIVAVAREQARLSKKLLFLAKSHQIFHLWHVVHRPFSYSFAVLALIHVTIAMLFGFFR